MKYNLKTRSDNGECVLCEEKIVFTASDSFEKAFFKLDIEFPDWDDDDFVFMPSCVYNGNKIKKTHHRYPPMYTLEETRENVEYITGVPALNPDGSGKIEVTSGDMATPCVSIFSKKKKKSFFFLSEQEVGGRNIGFTVEKGKVTISFPEQRELMYKMCRLEPAETEQGMSVKKGEEIFSRYKIFEFNCSDFAEFYEQYFIVRKSLMSDERAPFIYTKELWNIMENHFNNANFSGEYYSQINKVWYAGWLGGGISTYPLLKCGSDLSKDRAIKTIDFFTKKQGASGFYYGIVENGEIKDDSFGREGLENLHLVRKSADILYFLIKTFSLITPKKEWLESARKCADAFCNAFEKYGTFGQFVNVETGNMIVGVTSSATLGCASLLKAGEYFKDERYKKIAKQALEFYKRDFLNKGYTNGGPGEILSAPDSESGFALLESAIVMYENTRDEKWLDFAKTMAHYVSSWVVTYSYKFPKTSQFGKLGINTVGSIFANVQNKHSSPGICTLSGDSLLKLYRYTKNEAYLELIKDIAYFIPQCVSTEERPIYSWDEEPVKLKEGYICERVNMSDWERYKWIGEVFNFSCWCETSLILSFAELMSEEEMI